MNASQQLLFDRLMDFQIDEQGTQLTFARRLARENGWSLAYSERVIVEYKKFLFLVLTAGHIVSPSEQVDQAWHLHLTYTRSYWDDLCRNVLGQPLHHGPTKGGAAEQAKFVDLYNQTLASYQRLLNQQAPYDIWSPTVQRFGEDLLHVQVNTAKYWIIPKPRLPGWPARAPLLMAGLFGMPVAVATWNPLDWQGPQFLACYLILAVVAALFAWAARVLLSPHDSAMDTKGHSPLDPYETACLAAGPARAMQAAFAAMVQEGTLRVVSEENNVLGIFPRTKRTIQQGQPLPANAPRLERALFDATTIPAADFAPLSAAGLPVAQDIRDSLQKRLMQSQFPSAASALAATIMAAPLLLGLPKIVVGLSRGKPVEFLVMACVMTSIAALAFLLARSRLTASGKSTLQSLQANHAASATDTAALNPADLAMAVGLFGVGMLAVGPLSSAHAMLPRASGGGGCSSGGCSNGGCGGGGCGGGGCGGGGCGGCGS